MESVKVLEDWRLLKGKLKVKTAPQLEDYPIITEQISDDTVIRIESIADKKLQER